MLFYEHEPWGCLVEDFRFEQLTALTFQANTPANTPTPRFFDRRSMNEIARDERLERARTRETMADRMTAFFAARMARQAEDVVVGQVDATIEIAS